MIVIPSNRRWSHRRLLALIPLHALPITAAICLTIAPHKTPTGSPPAWNAMAGMFVIPAAVVVFLIRSVYPRIGFRATIVYCVLLAGVTTITAASALGALFPQGFVMAYVALDLQGGRLEASSTIFVPILLLGIPTAVILRLHHGRLVLQDGKSCPRCGYCVAGVRSRICPECGREFTFQELGTTEEELLGGPHPELKGGAGRPQDP